jgi:hypothetical protein
VQANFSLTPQLKESPMYEFVISEVRDFTDPHVAWKNTLDYCNSEKPCDKWAQLPNPNIEKDVNDLVIALNAFHAEIKDLKIVQLFLDVDTLNQPYTELRASSDLSYSLDACKPHSITSLALLLKSYGRWIKFDPFYRKSIINRARLIKSYGKWEKLPDDLNGFADYVIPLAYSGIIFVEALKRSEKFEMRIDWGFSEGDIFILYEEGKRVCKSE